VTTAAPPHLPLTDPATLLAIAHAAHRMGDRYLERAARKLLREGHGIVVSFCRVNDRKKRAPDATR
jgi:hypothetical protein